MVIFSFMSEKSFRQRFYLFVRKELGERGARALMTAIDVNLGKELLGAE